jgi:hypothetical protein
MMNRRNFVLAAAAAQLLRASKAQDTGKTAHGDLIIDNITNHSTGTYESLTGSVFINQKVDDHSNIHIKAAKEVHIGQKIDQHSQVKIDASGDISIGEKIDQHSVGIITSGNGNVRIGQKIDQHSWARISVPNGCLKIGQGVDQHSHLHYRDFRDYQNYLGRQPQCGSAVEPVENGSTVDNDMTVGWDPKESGPGS